MPPKIIFSLGNALDNISKYKKYKFDLLMTSPPYNIGKEYESGESFDDYIEGQRLIIHELVKYISERGSICWQVGNSIDQKTKEIIPLDYFFYKIFKEEGFFLRNRIIWHFGHGLHSSTRFSGRYETILWFTKSEKYIFNLDEVRIPSKYPGKKSFKGPNKGNYSGNPKGKNPSDVWEIVANDWDKEIWEIPNVKAMHKEKTKHPCQYPIELVERCILALTNEGSWVLDPFSGVGSTMLAAYKNNRNSLGIELHKEYMDIAKERYKALKNGELRIRPIGTEIYDHKRSKLSRVPEDFKGKIDEN